MMEIEFPNVNPNWKWGRRTQQMFQPCLITSPNYTFADKPARRKLLSSMNKFYDKLNLKLFAAITKKAA